MTLVIEVMIVKQTSGSAKKFENPSRTPRIFENKGKKLTYLVMGDSTSAGQGAEYEKGIAVLTAQHLAKTYRVTMINTSISGAVTKELLTDQISILKEIKPDVVLLSIGANDVTHTTNVKSLEKDLSEVIDRLIAHNCDVKIILTGSPDMGAIEKFLFPLSWIVGLRTNIVNSVFNNIVFKYTATLAPIAEKTGPLFRADRSLFAADGYHPNERGYAIWIPVLTDAIDTAIRSQLSRCR